MQIILILIYLFTLPFKIVGVSKKIILLSSKYTLNESKVTVNTFIM